MAMNCSCVASFSKALDSICLKETSAWAAQFHFITYEHTSWIEHNEPHSTVQHTPHESIIISLIKAKLLRILWKCRVSARMSVCVCVWCEPNARKIVSNWMCVASRIRRALCLNGKSMDGIDQRGASNKMRTINEYDDVYVYVCAFCVVNACATTQLIRCNYW